MRGGTFILACVGEDHFKRAAFAEACIRRVSKSRIITVCSRVSHVEESQDLVVVPIDDQYTNHQASILLKTGCADYIDDQEGTYCYIDTDVIALTDQIDRIFDIGGDGIRFGQDGKDIDAFSPWAVRCACDQSGKCGHLREKIQLIFGVTVHDPKWELWNGGVFVFNKNGKDLLRLWNEYARTTLCDTEWRVRDQGALAAASWALGMAEQKTLDRRFNWIVDCMQGVPVNRRATVAAVDLMTDQSYSLSDNNLDRRPAFVHFINGGVGRRGWKNWDEVETIIGSGVGSSPALTDFMRR